MSRNYRKTVIATALLATLVVSVPLSSASAQEPTTVTTVVNKSDQPQEAAPKATGKTYYVDNVGTGTGDSASSKIALTSVLSKVQDGDTLILHGNVVFPAEQALYLDKKITIKGSTNNPKDTMLNVRVMQIELGADVVFENLDLHFGHYPTNILDLGGPTPRKNAAIYASGHQLTMKNVYFPYMDTAYRVLPNIVAGSKKGGQAEKAGKVGNNAVINLESSQAGQLNVRHILGSEASNPFTGNVTVNLKGRPVVYGTPEILVNNAPAPEEPKTPGAIRKAGATGTFIVNLSDDAAKIGPSVSIINGADAVNLTNVKMNSLSLENSNVTIKNGGIWRPGKTSNGSVKNVTLESGGKLDISSFFETFTIAGNFVGGGELEMSRDGDLKITGQASGNTTVNIPLAREGKTYVTAGSVSGAQFTPADSSFTLNNSGNSWATPGAQVGQDDDVVSLAFTNGKTAVKQKDIVTFPQDPNRPSDYLFPVVELADTTGWNASGQEIEDLFSTGLEATVKNQENKKIAHLYASIQEGTNKLILSPCGALQQDGSIVVGDCEIDSGDSNEENHKVKPGTYEIELTYTPQSSSPVTVGKYTFVVQADGDSSTPTIPVESVSLNKKQLILKKDASETLTAILNPGTATNTAVTWESDKPDIAEVKDGVVTAKAPGTATITVTTKDGSKKATCQVLVEGDSGSGGGQVEDLELNKSSLSMKKGATETLTVSPSGTKVTWSSSNSDIAAVKDGVVTAKGSGMAVIKAEAEDGRTVECTVYVDADVPTLPPDTDVDDSNLLDQIADQVLSQFADKNSVSVDQGIASEVPFKGESVQNLLDKHKKPEIEFQVTDKTGNNSDYSLTYKKEDVNTVAGKKENIGLLVSVEEVPKDSQIDIDAKKISAETKPTLKFQVKSSDLQTKKFHLYKDGKKVSSKEYQPALEGGKFRAAGEYSITVELDGPGSYELRTVTTSGNGGSTGGGNGGSSGGSGSNRPSKPSKPTNPITPPTTPPTTPSSSVKLDTTSVNMVTNGTYQFLVKGNNDTANIKVEVTNPNVASVALVDGKDSRGAKYQVTAKAAGETDIKVTYQGQSTSMKVKVAASKGSITLDTAQYTMAPGNMYTIGAFIKDEKGNQLTPAQVKDLVSSGKLVVRDSRTGSIVDLVQLSTGHFRVIGKNEGTCYILYEIGGTHASVRIDVKNGAKAGGSAVRNTSYFIS